ncbi:hypothetical protein LTR16_004508 [Cryomyces antarcticus]|uniref:Uncharacterized protein n=1 Tax=Cryomyces antarcticus TaxID=329879 RepID=A0ABR0LX51_9PEZI|nr:hypothetical protein LTR16_004508 [Cryomyces antarcticus]
MRASLRLLASVKPVRYLEAGAPTGLTGLFTHPAPRSALIYLYSSTLDKLKRLPEHSAYRTATEALTKQRLSIIEAVKPDGYEEWQKRINEQVAENPEAFSTYGIGVKHEHSGRQFVTTRAESGADEREEEWDGEMIEAPALEGPRSSKERAGQAASLSQPREVIEAPALEGPRSSKERAGQAADSSQPREVLEMKDFKLEKEPPLTAQQISDIEVQIGAGLIEEVIQVAEGEHMLVNTMLESKVWEELEEKPTEGQWTYYERGANVGTTQKP